MTTSASAKRRAAGAADAGAGTGPWWRHPMMWLVVGGPLVVVVAGFVTFWLAARAPDPVLVVPRGAAPGAKDAAAPAMQARNHVATPPAAAVQPPAGPAAQSASGR